MRAKKLLILLPLVITGCASTNSTSTSNTTNSNIEKNSSSSSNWENLGFSDIYDIGFSVNFSSTFNNESINIEQESSVLYSPEEGNYIDSAVDHYYYIYNDLISKEHIKKEQKDINTFKISADKKFNNIWLENVYKLNYVNNELVKTSIDKVTYNKTQDSISLNLEKDENCSGYYFEVNVAYILKDIRGFMYYTGSMVLF